TTHLKYLGTSLKNLHDFRRFRPLRVILIPRCENNRSVAIENISRRNRQLPAVIAVGERQIDERSPVYRLLRRGHAVGQSKLACNLVTRVGEQSKAQLVLIVHEE